MPKRSAQMRIERYARKIRKLEERENRRKVISPFDSSSESNNEGCEVAVNQRDDLINMTADNINANTPEVLLTVPEGPEFSDQQGPNQEIEPSVEIELDPEILSALGESMSDAPDYGDVIHENLAKLWTPLLKKGVSTESKNKLLKEYLVPENCRLLQAPKLNAEISAAVPDMVRNRDKVLSSSQQQLGLGITAINRGLDILLKSDDKVQAMKHLSNGCRLLCDSHNAMTKNRVKLLTPSLDKAVLHIVNESERDDTLFGSLLSEKIKAAKAIEKQGLQIKKPLTKPLKSVASLSGSQSVYPQGNWSGPPRYPQTSRGGRGGYRKPHMMSLARQAHAPSGGQIQRSAIQASKTRAPARSLH